MLTFFASICSVMLQVHQIEENIYIIVYHTTKTVYAKVLASLDGHYDSFACNVEYLIAIVYSHLTMTIVRLKPPYTIGVKYKTPHAKLSCPSREAIFFAFTVLVVWSIHTTKIVYVKGVFLPDRYGRFTL